MIIKFDPISVEHQKRVDFDLKKFYKYLENTEMHGFNKNATSQI